MLGDLPVDHPVDLQTGKADLPVGGWEAPEGACMGAREQDALGDHPLVGRGVQNREVEVGEAFEEDAEELNPGVAVERCALDAVGRVRDVVSGSGRGFRGVVAGVERIDPSTRRRSVVLGHCGGARRLGAHVRSLPSLRRCSGQAGMPGGPRISSP
jgi:hypothetical protein